MSLTGGAVVAEGWPDAPMDYSLSFFGAGID
jgi:hypothetical protein